MLGRSLRACVAVVGLGFVTSLVQAQVSSAAGRVYRLTRASDYEEGCFGPCECITFYHGQLRGVFVMTFKSATPNGGTLIYDVSHVKFVATTSPTATPVGTAIDHVFTGSGEYQLSTSFDTPNVYTGTLALTLDQPGQPTYVFDGGPSPEAGGVLYPPIKISIDRNNQVCYDQVLNIVAKPVSADWDDSGVVDVRDIFAFLNDWFSNDPSACYCGGSSASVKDLFTFLQDWFAGK